jgi:hypothetical protein
MKHPVTVLPLVLAALALLGCATAPDPAAGADTWESDKALLEANHRRIGTWIRAEMPRVRAGEITRSSFHERYRDQVLELRPDLDYLLDALAELIKLSRLHEAGLITLEEYGRKGREIQALMAREANRRRTTLEAQESLDDYLEAQRRFSRTSLVADYRETLRARLADAPGGPYPVETCAEFSAGIRCLPR